MHNIFETESSCESNQHYWFRVEQLMHSLNDIIHMVTEPEIFRERVALATHVKKTQIRSDLALERAVSQIWTEATVLSPNDFDKIKNAYDKVYDMKALDDKHRLLKTTKGSFCCYTLSSNKTTLNNDIENLITNESRNHPKGYIFLRTGSTECHIYSAIPYGFEQSTSREQNVGRRSRISLKPNLVQAGVLKKLYWPNLGYQQQNLSEQDEYLVSTLLLDATPTIAIRVNHIFWKDETAARFSCYLSKKIRMESIVVEKSWFLEAIRTIANTLDPRAYCSNYYQTRGLDSKIDQTDKKIYELIYALMLAFIRENINEVSRNARHSVEQGVIL